jgi:hypothetical protein
LQPSPRPKEELLSIRLTGLRVLRLLPNPPQEYSRPELDRWEPEPQGWQPELNRWQPELERRQPEPQGWQPELQCWPLANRRQPGPQRSRYSMQ